MNKENIVATMLAVYAILLTLCFAIYAYIDIFNIDKSLASNLLVWSATLFAPIAVLYSLGFWKVQKKQEEKIEVLKSIKKKVVDFHVITDSFRSSSKALYHIQNGEATALKVKIEQYSKNFTDLLKILFFEINSADEFLQIDEIDQLNNLLTKLWYIPYEFEKAEVIINAYNLPDSKNKPSAFESFEYEKSLYLLEPSSWIFQRVLNNKENKIIFENFEDLTFQSLNDLTELISVMLKDSFK
ncbi:hypothetical protein KTI63_03285 [Acinetobacter guillouiae]|uniref:hypothetical protein n=1 Tax=Acinetobacter guillouiae TaxID=106649 RepID=UPI0021CEEFA7|nr:hypothetical protein [Acinetobacter guillouiae]MCU4491489.1 hypothetical protein [Acinetobacter guillouiae]